MASNTTKRIASVDRLRGLCMIAVVVQFIMGALGDTFESWALLLEHGEDGFQVLPGVAFADLFAPMFIFIIGLTLTLTYASREKKYGDTRAFFDMGIRFLSLMGMGALLSSIENGWLEILLEGAAFEEIDTNMKVFMIAGAVAALLLLLTFLHVPYASTALRFVLALMGAAIVFFIAVSAADRIVPKIKDSYPSKIFGGYVWDTLQNIGFAGLLALPMVKLNKWGKLSVALGYFVFFGAYAQAGGYYILKNMLEGAPFSGFCWAGILLLGSFFMDIKDNLITYWCFALGTTGAAVVMIKCFGLIAAKRGCTPAYALLTAGVSAILFGLLLLSERVHVKVQPLTWWGGSCILTYVLNYVLCLGISALFDAKELTLPVWQGLVITAVYLVLFTLLNYALAKKEKHVKL